MTEGASTLMDMRLLAAQAVAREAGAMARRRFLDQSFTVGFKGPQDFLTEVDGETEAFIAERLLEIFPTDGFIGEESKARPAGEGGAAWVVDPIDGTANFARGVAAFLRVDRLRRRQGRGRRHLRSDARRIVRRPARRRRAAQRRADAGVGRERTRQLRNRGRLEHACERRPICRPLTTGRVGRALRRRAPAPARSRSLMSPPAGSMAIVEHHMNAWDCLAGILLVSEAGGYVNDFLRADGLTKGNPLVACAPGVKDALIAAAAFEGVTI